MLILGDLKNYFKNPYSYTDINPVDVSGLLLIKTIVSLITCIIG
jgi:hypothetical protein